MCIAISIPDKFSAARRAVKVVAVVETLVYRSETQEVVISFDCIVRNEADYPVDLWVTHVDNVEGRLATEDWFSYSSFNGDERAELVASIHNGGWNFDGVNGILKYQDPIETFVDESENCDLVARALSFRNDQIHQDRATQVYSDLIDFRAPPFTESDRGACAPVYRLATFPKDPMRPEPNGDFLPYSTFRVGPIQSSRAGLGTMFRITVVIAREAYRRLIQPRDGASFGIYSSERVCNTVMDFALPRFERNRRFDEYKSFFEKEVVASLITPEKYQIVILQPTQEDTRRRCVIARPTSSRISQRVIQDSNLRKRAMWFNAWSSDFTMVLEYGEPSDLQASSYRADMEDQFESETSATRQ